MSSGRGKRDGNPRSARGQGGPAGPAGPPAAAGIWAWASALAVFPVVLHSLGAPLGEPVADDFDHLYYALFSSSQSWLEGGGSGTFWRPLAYQGYYGLLSGIILTQPLVTVALHVVLLAATAFLLCRAAARFVPGPWAAAIATFPLLAESTRALIAVPVHFVDLGLLFFSALAIHEATRARLPTSLGALLAALLCKESAVATALLLPLLPRRRAGETGAPGRRRWAMATGIVTLGWGLAYLVVRARGHMVIPGASGPDQSGRVAGLWERYAWAIDGSLRAAFSLPAEPGSRGAFAAVGAEAIAAAGMIVLIGMAAVIVARSAAARARLVAARPIVALGLLWSALAFAPLIAVYPIWSPQRVAFVSLGLGTALACGLGAAHTGLLVGFVTLRLALFALSPSPPTAITVRPVETGSWVDFDRLVRLQRLMRETRTLLQTRYPELPRGALVVQHNLPWMSYYAFGGSKALQVWYRDPTLHWLAFDEFRRKPALQPVTVVEWQPYGSRQMAAVETDAMRALLDASDRLAARDWTGALAALDSADARQRDPAARVFLGTVASKRALGLASLGRGEEAMRAALEALRLWPHNPDSRYAAAQVLAAEGRLDEAAAQLDTLLRLYPNDAQARELRGRLLEARPAP